MQMAWDGPSLQTLCWILWELRVRPYRIAGCLSSCPMLCFRKSWRAQGSCTVLFLSIADLQCTIVT